MSSAASSRRVTHKPQAAEEEAEDAVTVAAATVKEERRRRKKAVKQAAAAAVVAKETEAGLRPSFSLLQPSPSSSPLAGASASVAAPRPASSLFAPFPALDWLSAGNHLNSLASFGFFLLNSSRVIIGDDINTVITASLSNSNMLALGLLFVGAAACYCADVQSFPAHWTRRMFLNPIRKREARREELEEEGDEAEVAEESSYQPPSLALDDSAAAVQQQQQSPEQHAGRVSMNSPSPSSSSSRSSASSVTSLISVVVSSSADLDRSLVRSSSRSARGRSRRCLRFWRWRVEAWVVLLDLVGALLSSVSSLLPFCLSSLLARGGTTSYDSVPVSIAWVDLLSMCAWTLSAILAFYVWRRDKIQVAREAFEREQSQLELMRKRIESIDQAQAAAAAATDRSDSLSKPGSTIASSSSTLPAPRAFAPHSDSRLWLDPFDLGWWSAALNLAASVVYLSACVYGLNLSLAVRQHVVEAKRKTDENRSNANGNNGNGNGLSALIGADPNSGGNGNSGGSTWQPAVSIGITPQQIQSWVHLQRKLNVMGDVFYLLCAIFCEVEYYKETNEEISEEEKEQKTRKINGDAANPSH